MAEKSIWEWNPQELLCVIQVWSPDPSHFLSSSQATGFGTSHTNLHAKTLFAFALLPAEFESDIAAEIRRKYSESFIEPYEDY